MQITIQHLSNKDPSVFEELRTENIEQKKRVSTLTDEIQITKELLHYHAAENNKMALLLQTLFLSLSYA